MSKKPLIPHMKTYSSLSVVAPLAAIHCYRLCEEYPVYSAAICADAFRNHREKRPVKSVEATSFSGSFTGTPVAADWYMARIISRARRPAFPSI